jgi:hypothetical protein
VTGNAVADLGYRVIPSCDDSSLHDFDPRLASLLFHSMQRISRGPDKGHKVPTDKRPLRHLARFILIGIYRGSRAGAIAAASPIQAIGRAFVDLDRGRYCRRKQGSVKTNKRQPTVPIPTAERKRDVSGAITGAVIKLPTGKRS